MIIPTPHWKHVGISHECQIDYTVSPPRLLIRYPRCERGGVLAFDARAFRNELSGHLGLRTWFDEMNDLVNTSCDAAESIYESLCGIAEQRDEQEGRAIINRIALKKARERLAAVDRVVEAARAGHSAEADDVDCAMADLMEAIEAYDAIR